ncbi:hypothetical protein DV735_g2063, partial [Chaetothyriales sp. CBS 134920]
MPKEKAPGQDAGLRSLDHYRIRLPRWRYAIREKLLPIVRWETPYVAWLQNSMRRPLLDSYFAMTANLGTHTFFMIILPVLFWCGQTRLGRGMSTTLAAGVFFSGFVKDFLCLPRPLSPPLTRITMSGSASLEYGFPSTHSTNAVSSAVYALFLLRENGGQASTANLGLQVLCYFYAFSIVLGRLYCGMHGFFDVFWGTVLGAAIALVQIGLSFAGVVMGCQAGGWHFARTHFSVNDPMPSTAEFDLQRMGWLVVAARIVLGVALIFAWRAVMKPTLLTILPPIFRVVEHYGLTLPRRYFLPASQYETVPNQKYDDNVIPRARDIPSLLSNFRRRRAISVGPQSEADAYEALAFREKRRRDSINASTSALSGPGTTTTSSATTPTITTTTTAAPLGDHSRSNSIISTRRSRANSLDHEQDQARSEEEQQKELFAHLQQPRVRYDVEVITKLIVYSGIAWLAVEGNPIIFEPPRIQRHEINLLDRSRVLAVQVDAADQRAAGDVERVGGRECADFEDSYHQANFLLLLIIIVIVPLHQDFTRVAAALPRLARDRGALVQVEAAVGLDRRFESGYVRRVVVALLGLGELLVQRVVG